MKQLSDNYAAMFQDVLWDNCLALLKSPWKRDRNPGAPSAFGETHLRNYVQKALKSRLYIPPSTWPQLVVERGVQGDRKDAAHRHGAVDYFFTAKGDERSLHLSDLLASCEVGGPTRPKLLAGSQANWYPKIVADIEKQLWRASHAGTGHHFVSVFIQPRSGYEVEADFGAVLRTMIIPLPDATLGDVVWSRRADDVPDLHLVTLRVLPHNSSAF